MITTDIFKKLRNIRGSIQKTKKLEMFFIKRISRVIRFGTQTSIYKSKVSSSDLNAAQSLVLSLLHALSTGDINSCLILIQIATSLDHLKSKYLATWLLNDYNFDKQSVKNGLKMFRELISENIIKVPTDLMTLFSILAQKYVKDINDSLDDRLCMAVHNNNVAKLVLLATEGANVNLRTSSGDSLYHLAVSGSCIDSIHVLKYLKADIEARDIKLETPLFKAAIADNKEVVNALLLAGAEINKLFKGGNQLIHLAAQKHCNDALEALVESANVEVYNHNNQSPLMLAVENKNIVGVKLLLRKKADFNRVGKNGETSLHIACRLNISEIVKELINAGINVNIASAAGLMPIHLCGDRITIEIMSVFKNVLDSQTTDLNTALHLAIRNNNNEVAKALIKCGAKVNIKNENEETPLIIAVNQNNLEIVNLLLDSGADPNAIDNKGYSAACRAVEHDGLAILQVLKAAGAYIKVVIRNNNFTLLHIAVINGHNDMVDFLLDTEAVVLVNEKCKYEACHIGRCTESIFFWTAFHLACFKGFYSIVHSLLQSNASIDAKDNNNITPLHLAAFGGHVSIIKTLLANGVSISSKTIKNETACHIAADRGHLEVIKLLVENGAEVNDPGYNNQTMLHYAAVKNHLDIAKYLLDKGANINSVNSSNQTPLSLTNNSTEMFRLLSSRGGR